MFESFTKMGYWWLPDDPENSIPGKLDFNIHEGAVLELFGRFSGLDISNIKDWVNYDIIHGLLQGQDVTLYKCAQVGSTLNEMKIKIQYIIFGFCFKNAEEILFNKFDINFQYLDYWFNNRIIEAKGIDEYKINQKEPFVVYEDESSKNMVSYYVIINFENRGSRKICLNENVKWIIETKEKDWNLNDIKKYVRILGDLFTIFLGIPIHPSYLAGYNDSNFVEFPEGKKNYVPMEIFYSISFVEFGIKYDDKNMLFKYEDYSTRIPSVFKSWFKKRELLNPVFNLMLSVKYNPYMYQQTKFLNLCEAIEVYHREIKGKSMILKKRIINLLDAFPFLDRIFSDEDELFANKVVDTRNYLVHYEGKKKYKVTDTFELHKLIDKITLVLYSCVLYELGFTNDEIFQILNNNKALLYYKESKPLFKDFKKLFGKSTT